MQFSIIQVYTHRITESDHVFQLTEGCFDFRCQSFFFIFLYFSKDFIYISYKYAIIEIPSKSESEAPQDD